MIKVHQTDFFFIVIYNEEFHQEEYKSRETLKYTRAVRPSLYKEIGITGYQQESFQILIDFFI
jgi:hypothetical protein